MFLFRDGWRGAGGPRHKNPFQNDVVQYRQGKRTAEIACFLHFWPVHSSRDTGWLCFNLRYQMQFNIKHQAAAGGAVPREHHRHLSQPNAGRGQKLVRVYLPLQKLWVLLLRYLHRCAVVFGWETVHFLRPGWHHKCAHDGQQDEVGEFQAVQQHPHPKDLL